jgi:YD repeat-containing protein
MMAATALLHVREYEAAIRAFESAVDLAPDQPRPRYQLAVACALAGKRERSLANLAGAVEAGFRQPDVLAAEPAFEAYRNTSTYRSSLALAARNQHPCAEDADHRVFDFFVGHWTASTPDGTVAGTNRIEAVLGGAALVERWTSVNGYTGTSLNRLDTATGTWRQTWVDDQGDVVEFVDGRYDDGAMRFSAHRDGVDRRLTFFHEGPDALRQLSEQSDDGGATWSVEYDLRYRRIAIADALGAA